MNNEHVKSKQNKRSRIFEFFLVFIVIGLLLYILVDYYTPPVKKSQTSMIDYHAGIFSRMVSNLGAYSVATNSKAVFLRDQAVYFNELGWPANSDAEESPLSKDQTNLECQQLWQTFFTHAPSNHIPGQQDVDGNAYEITLIEPFICRYQLSRKQEGSYFFDYDVSTGEVKIHQQ